MSPRYLRGEVDARDTAAAALAATALAVGVGVVAFYFTRLLLSREPIGVPTGEAGEAAPERAALPSSPEDGE